ncbi:PREDICTED: homeobox protein Nkx-2.3 [Haliaeetus leucocephalus]|uniref:homeobox protein Nkx-2.3 n=1 Tax=Haliaeetus leucocephalus TaxID=52644 RepID=UPI00053CB48F|nr:PREDICTED: homeobox protein Nkx-2.3 [Haliaeetus leucocephalus]
MMLPSPVTSTPFSVKDILNLEQQQDPRYGAQLPHHLEHHFHPAACLLAAADGARFSDGEEEEEEEKLSYLSPMAASGGQADARISADNYVHAVLRGSCEAPGPGEELDTAARDPSEYRPRRAAPPCAAPPGRARARSPRCVPSPLGTAPRSPGARRRVPWACRAGTGTSWGCHRPPPLAVPPPSPNEKRLRRAPIRSCRIRPALRSFGLPGRGAGAPKDVCSGAVSEPPRWTQPGGSVCLPPRPAMPTVSSPCPPRACRSTGPPPRAEDQVL